MATKVGAIYVEVRGDDTQWKKDMAALRSAAAQSGKNVSDALNSAINPSKASSGIQTISTGLTQLAQTAKVPEKQFKQTADAITDAFSDVAKSVGMTRKEFADLNERMLRNKAFQTAANELKSLSYAAGLSVSETKKLAQQMGYTSSQAGEMANKIHRVQQESNATVDVFSRLAVAAVAAFSIHEIADFTNKIKDAGVEVESLGFAYLAITGSQSKAAKEMEYVNTTAKSLGLGLTTLEKSYKGLLAASQGTSLEGENTRKIFTAVSKASAVLGLSADQTAGALLALEQMMSKGTVQSEELRGQLGERLYGALNKAAEAMGVTTAELSDMLKQGEVIAEDFLPKFADVLERDFGKAAEDAGYQARAAFENFSTAVIELKRALAESGILEYLAKVTRNATGMINEVKDAINSFNAGKMKTSVVEYDVALTKAKANLSEFIGMHGNTRDLVPDAMKERFDDLTDAVEVLSKAKDNLSRSLQNDQDWKAYGKEAVKTFGTQVSEADKAAKELESTLRKSYEKSTTFLLAEKKKQLALYMQYEGRKPEYVAQLQSEIAALEKRAASSSIAEHKKATSAYKKEIEEQKRVLDAFNKDYDQATLPSFDLQIKQLDDQYAYYDKFVKDKVKLDQWYVDSYFDIYNSQVEKEVNEQQKAIKEQKDIREKALKEEQRVAKESQEMRYNMLNDLGGSGYYDEQIKAIEDYAQKYVDLTKDIVTAEAWKNNKIQKLNAETALKDIKSREESFSEISSNLSSIADLYKEGSKEQQAASTAAKIAYAAEMAMLAEKNIMLAVGAVANQGTSGDPYTAFVRIAAMTAAMASLLSIANIDFSAGSSGGGDVSMDRTGIVSGSGTVLGDTSALSESVSNAMETLEDIGADQYDTLVDIFYEMQDLNTNITNLATSIVQEYGKFSAESLGVSEGYVPTSVEDWGTMAEGFAEKFFYIAGDLGTGWLSGLVTGWAGDIVNSIFGGGQTSTLTGAGFQVSPYVAGQDLLVQAYQDIKVEEDGGWFHSDKSWTETKLQAVDEEITKYFSSILNSFSDMAMSFVDELGVSTEAAVASYTFDIGKINLKDLTGEEISDTLITVFSEVGDELVASLFYEAVAPYQEVGEGLLEAATRIVATKNIVEDAFDSLGISFNFTASESIKLSQRVVDLSGDLESFQRNFESFYGSFYSTAEIQSNFAGNASSIIKSIDDSIEFPATKEAFKSLVSGLDMTTDSGVRLYVALMSLVDGADEYYSYLDDVADFTSVIQDSIDDNTLGDYERSMKALNKWYEDQIKTVVDLGVGVDSLTKAYYLQKGIIEDTSDAFRIVELAINGQLTAAQQFEAWQINNAEALSLYTEMTGASVTKDELEGAIDAFVELGLQGEDLNTVIQDLADRFSDATNQMLSNISDIESAQGNLKGDNSSQYVSKIASVLSYFQTIPTMAEIRGDETITKAVLNEEAYKKAIAEAVVNSEFQSIFGRLPSGDYWVNALLNGNVSFGGLSDAIIGGIDNNEDFVTEIFTRLFGRTPSSSYWVDALDSGLVTRGNVESAILAGATGSDLTATGRESTNWVDFDTAAIISGISAIDYYDTQKTTMSGEFSTSEAEVLAAIGALQALPEVIVSGVINDSALTAFVDTLSNMDAAVLEDIFGADAASQINTLASAVDEYYSSANTAASSTNDLAKAVDELADATSAREEAARSYRDALQDEVDILEDTLSDAKSTYIDLLNDELSAQEGIADSMRDAVDAMEEFRESIWTGESSPYGASTRADLLYKQVKDLYGKAMDGDTEAMHDLIDVSSQYLDVSKATSAEWSDYQREAIRIASMLSDVESYAGEQAISADAQVAALQNIINDITGVDNTITDINIAREKYEAAQLALDNTWMTDEIVKLDGILESNKSIAELMKEFIAAQKSYLDLGGEDETVYATPGSAVLSTITKTTGVSPNALVSGTLTAKLNQMIDNGTYSPLAAAIAASAFSTQIRDATDVLSLADSLKTTGFATGGSFSVAGASGLDNLSLPNLRVTAGEMVNITRGNTMESLIDEMKSLRSQVAALTAEVKSGNVTTRKTLDITDKWDKVGTPTRSVA